MDVRNFEEVWDWTNGVLIEGLFESDVDDTGNIMMYNQLVGAIRFRQQRVTNTSCFLSESVQRKVRISGYEFVQSFYYPAPDLGTLPRESRTCPHAHPTQAHVTCGHSLTPPPPPCLFLCA
jgi:hypothetical protein